MSEQKLYASKGEVVTCTNGHEICELGRNVYVGGNIESEAFVNWRNTEPAQPGDAFEPCKTCGASYIRSAGGFGARLHINGEWRTTR